MEQRKFRMPTAYTILFCLILLVALSTWFIPAGSYDYADGIPISGSYHAVAPAPQGIGAALKAAFRGFYDAVDVCVFILMVGGFLGVVMKTGAIDAGVSNVITRLQGRENLLITILMLFFGLGGTTYGMWEETMAFFPLLLPIFLAAGYDADVCVFDPQALHERATYTEPQQTSQGMSLVLVGGETALENGRPTGLCAGRAIRR